MTIPCLDEYELDGKLFILYRKKGENGWNGFVTIKKSDMLKKDWENVLLKSIEEKKDDKKEKAEG